MCQECEKKKRRYCGFKKLICKAVFQFCFQEVAVQTIERKVCFCQSCSSKPSSHQSMSEPREMCNPHGSGQVRERTRDSLAIVGGRIGPQLGQTWEGFCFPSLALLTTRGLWQPSPCTSATHGQWYLPAMDILWRQNTDSCPSWVSL